MQNILVVDDDPTVAEVVTGYLERAGYTVARAADGPGALEAAGDRWPDLVVLDLMLPGMDGLEVCRRLRGRGPVPVIMLTARGDEDDRILGLETGADDYVTKPFSPRELVLRVECVLRRGRSAADAAPGGPVLSCAGITVDPAARRVTKDGAEIGLTLREFDLLLHLMRHRGLAIGRERLMQEVWGWDFGDLSTVTVHVRRLRGKIEDDPARPRLIHTVWGVGYRFDAPAEPERRPVPTRGDAPGAPDTPGDPEGPAPGYGGARPPRPYDRTAAPEPDDRTTSAERPDGTEGRRAGRFGAERAGRSGARRRVRSAVWRA
ncbi:response regulator transcription factor [Streptomyces sp. PmtA]